MKKVTSSAFQKQFGTLTRHLADGQAMQVTHHGKPVGVFTKGPPRRIKMPDFMENLRKSGGDPEDGDRVLKDFDASLS
jgi:hypothetical protein